MLAYVFWHHAADGVDPASYEQSLSRFHAALAAHPPAGFIAAASFALEGAPWFPSGYLDWYTVADFSSLGLLNEAAAAGSRKAPHDDVARMAGDGLGGLYKLAAGEADFEHARTATWLKKPDGMSYDTFLAHTSALLDPAGMALWQRQMNLGPGLEFCLLSPRRIAVPSHFHPVPIELRPVGQVPDLPATD